MSRSEILQRIRTRLNVDDQGQSRRESAMMRMAQHRPNTVPARAQGDQAALISQFTDMLSRVHGSVARVSAVDQVPAAVSDYLGAAATLCLTRQVDAMALPWQGEAGLTLVPWAPRTSFEVCVTGCVAAAAETGTLVVASSPEVPLTQHFLGDTHIAILLVEQLFGAYEDIWNRVRKAMPRHLTFISGPSCTGDIEMIMEYGAHGPRNLHVILVGGDE